MASAPQGPGWLGVPAVQEATQGFPPSSAGLRQKGASSRALVTQQRPRRMGHVENGKRFSPGFSVGAPSLEEVGEGNGAGGD